MKVLVTGAKGFAGSNLCARLSAIRDGLEQRAEYETLLPLELRECGSDTPHEALAAWCADCDFVIHLAGVNRLDDAACWEGFMVGNAGFTETLLGLLEAAGNTCPVLFASSVQASLTGRFEGSAYGQSKRAAEELVFAHGERTGARTLFYRFPNIYGKWCRPHYNSAVATFCFNIARGLPVRVDDPAAQLDLLFIDDAVAEMIRALMGQENRRSDGFCEALPTDRASLGEIVALLEGFAEARASLDVPDLPEGSFQRKLHSTFASYIDPQEAVCPVPVKRDARGSFAELLHLGGCGQVSVNVAKPGVTKGQHWHCSKWERFCVVSGEGLVRMRRVGCDADGLPYPVIEHRVSGEAPTMVEILPGYAHSITNLSDTQDLVTLMWANEVFDPERPDTYYEEV